MADYKMLIDGALTDSDETIQVINPATEQLAGVAARGNKQLADKAVAAANKAFPAWADTPIETRADLLKKFADEIEANADMLAKLLTSEQGKPMAEAEAEVQYALAYIRYFAELRLEPKLVKDDETCRVEEHYLPLGAVVGIIPWNFPLLVMAFKLPPALLAGNTIIIKPAPTTPLATLKVFELTKNVFPNGVVAAITDENDLGGYLTSHKDIAKVSFTGSTATGQKVMQSAAATLKRLTLELGGNDPGIVLPDAEIDDAAEKIFAASFGNCGQVCIALKRAYVHADIYEDVCAKLVELAQAAIVDDGSKQGTTIGPLQNKMQFEKVKAFLAQAKKDGIIAAGGEIIDRAGYFVTPTIVRDVEDGTDIVDEEQFGPILPVVKFDDIDKVIKNVNASPYGLGASVWSADVEKAQTIAKRVVAGTVWVNQHFSIAPDIPFGGAKNSGIGIEFAEVGLAEYTQRQIINTAK